MMRSSTSTWMSGLGKAVASVSMRRMRRDDIAAADRLRALAGWNQTQEDWARLLDWEPDGCFVAEQDATIVGSATSTTFGRDLAWVGMMLVDPERRRQGIARCLLSRVLDWLESDRRVRSVALD